MNHTSLLAKYSKAMDLTTKGEFGPALDSFRLCLQSIPLLVLSTKQEAQEIGKLVKNCTEYITAMRIELERKKLVAVIYYSIINVL